MIQCRKFPGHIPCLITVYFGIQLSTCKSCSLSSMSYVYKYGKKKQLSYVSQESFSPFCRPWQICGLINCYNKNTDSRLTCPSSWVLFCSCLLVVAQLHPIKFRRQGAWLKSEWRLPVCSKFTIHVAVGLGACEPGRTFFPQPAEMSDHEVISEFVMNWR